MLKVVNILNSGVCSKVMMNLVTSYEIGIVYDIVCKAIAVNYQNEKEIKICISGWDK